MYEKHDGYQDRIYCCLCAICKGFITRCAYNKNTPSEMGYHRGTQNDTRKNFKKYF